MYVRQLAVPRNICDFHVVNEVNGCSLGHNCLHVWLIPGTDAFMMQE